MVNFTIIGGTMGGASPASSDFIGMLPDRSGQAERHEDPDKSGPVQIQTACWPPLSESQIDAD